jgi:hypothetical protein
MVTLALLFRPSTTPLEMSFPALLVGTETGVLRLVHH